MTTIDNQEEIIFLLNQLFEIEGKLKKLSETNSIHRNTKRIYEFLNQKGYFYHNPIGESYNETRTDCEATISGSVTADLIIVEVIKPVIHLKKNNTSHIIQKAIVIVEGK